MPATTTTNVFTGPAPGLGVDFTDANARFHQGPSVAEDALTPVPVPNPGEPPQLSWRIVTSLVVQNFPANGNELSALLVWFGEQALGAGQKIVWLLTPNYIEPSAADLDAQISSQDTIEHPEANPIVVEAGSFVTSADVFPTRGVQVWMNVQFVQDATAESGTVPNPRDQFYVYDET